MFNILMAKYRSRIEIFDVIHLIYALKFISPPRSSVSTVKCMGHLLSRL